MSVWSGVCAVVSPSSVLMAVVGLVVVFTMVIVVAIYTSAAALLPKCMLSM